MHYLCRCLYLLQVTLVAFGLTEAKADLALTNGCSVHFATVAEAKAHLAKGDVYIKGLSPFERAAKTKQAGPVSTEQYIEFIQNQTLEWDATDKAKLREVIAAAKPKLAKFAKHLPNASPSSRPPAKTRAPPRTPGARASSCPGAPRANPPRAWNGFFITSFFTSFRAATQD